MKITLLIPFILLFLFSCQTPQTLQINTSVEKQKINTLLNQWHHAAATANENAFFDAFTPNGIYIGTDATEHWTAKELQTWSKKAFDRDIAWAFEPYDRHIFFSKDGKTAWFDELLKTWMGECRGSGVLTHQNNQWKIAHYHLAVAVPNEKIQEYIQILEKEEKP